MKMFLKYQATTGRFALRRTPKQAVLPKLKSMYYSKAYFYSINSG